MWVCGAGFIHVCRHSLRDNLMAPYRYVMSLLGKPRVCGRLCYIINNLFLNLGAELSLSERGFLLTGAQADLKRQQLQSAACNWEPIHLWRSRVLENMHTCVRNDRRLHNRELCRGAVWFYPSNTGGFLLYQECSRERMKLCGAVGYTMAFWGG